MRVNLVIGFINVVYIVIFELSLLVGRLSVICELIFDLYIKQFNIVIDVYMNVYIVKYIIIIYKNEINNKICKFISLSFELKKKMVCVRI